MRNSTLERGAPEFQDGVLRCTRYAFGPNRLHYCGPDANREILHYLEQDHSDAGLKTLLSQFQTMYPYLRRIADSNNIRDPFDDRVVSAYWLGNDLLENVSKKELYDHLADDHNLKKRLDGKSFSRVADSIGKGAIPHHSFHVFAIWKRTGHVVQAHTVESMDACRVSAGKVLAVSGPFLTVSVKPLMMHEGKLALGEPIQKRIIRHFEAREDIEQVKIGDIVSIHWDVPCEVITSQQATLLERYTKESIVLANQIL